MNRNIQIDALRGICIFGVGFFNIIEVFLNFNQSNTFSFMKLYLNDIFWIVLSLVFGYSYFLYEKSSIVKNERNYFLKRMLVLYLLGLVNSFFFYGDILKDFAFIGACLYFIRSYLNKSASLTLSLLILMEIVCLIFIKTDFEKIPPLKSLYSENGVLMGNAIKSYYLNFHSVFFNTIYHLHMLILASIAYSYGKLIVEYKKVGFIKYILLLIAFVSGLGLLNSQNIEYINFIFFIYTNSLSIFLVVFWLDLTKYIKKANSFSRIGQLTLSIYFVQNIFVFLFTYFLFHYQPNLFYPSLLIVLSLPYLAIKIIGGSGPVEKIYRHFSQITS